VLLSGGGGAQVAGLRGLLKVEKMFVVVVGRVEAGSLEKDGECC